VELRGAALLVASTLVAYWVHLKPCAMSNVNRLKDQQQEWIDRDLTKAELVYLSKHNTDSTNDIDAGKLNDDALNQAMRIVFGRLSINDGYTRFVKAAVKAIHQTEFIRIVLHMGDVAVADEDTLVGVMASLRDIGKWATENPSACRVEVLFLGSNVSDKDLNSLIDKLKEVNSGADWTVQEDESWSGHVVELQLSTGIATFVTTQSRLGLRCGVE
jgi:hypothetical protein